MNAGNETKFGIMLAVANSKLNGTELDGLMRHTGADTVHELLMTLKSRSESLVLSLWALRFTR